MNFLEEKYISAVDYDHLYKIIRRKNISSKVLFRDENNNFLIVKSTNKKHWGLPGGISELNESPSETAKREVWEEIGIVLQIKRLLCVNYSSTKEIDSINFIFDGGVLSKSIIDTIRLQPDELDKYEFVSEATIATKVAERATFIKSGIIALHNTTIIYLENGIAL